MGYEVARKLALRREVLRIFFCSYLKGRRPTSNLKALHSKATLAMQVLYDGVVDCGEHAAEFLFVFFEERHAEALQVGAETGTRHNADSLRAQEVVNEAVVQVVGLGAPFFHFRLDARIFNLQALVLVQDAFTENDGVVECAVGRVEVKFRNVGKNLVDDSRTTANLFVQGLAVFHEARIAQHTRNSHLRKRRGADFHHLRVVQSAAEGVELFVLVAVVVFCPSAAGTRPRVLLGNALEGDARNVADVFGQGVGVGSIVRNLVVDFVADDKEVVALGDIHNLFEDFTRIDHAGRIVRVQNQDARDGRVVLHLVFQFLEVRVPVVFGLEAVGDRRGVCMGGFGGTVRAVCRSGAYNAGRHGKQAVKRCDGVAEAVEEQDVVDGNLCAAEFVVFLHQKFAGVEHSFRGAVAVTAVRLDEVRDNVLDPARDFALFLDGVADVFPVDFRQTKRFKEVCLLDYLTDFVRQFLGTIGKQTLSHFILLYRYRKFSCGRLFGVAKFYHVIIA